jgi:protein tyrosine phosphatase (PTP) superfamily phosphohydrolase (DUF442 family)
MKIHILLSLSLAMQLCSCAVGQRGFPAVGGIANLDRVDGRLYRGAQPNALGLRYLHSLGVRTVINLRGADEWTLERQEAEALGMRYEHVPMEGFGRPRTEDVVKALSIISRASTPVFVHCQFGCDRTGTIVACHRIQAGMASDLALKDAEFHGMSGLEGQMKNFIRNYEPLHIER